jgi:CHAT domain-containing protein
MNQLEQLIRLSKLRNEPVELLTLSACKTAVGDDQAALGLAGVAIKAGARTALATLWSIDDEATTLVIGEFYRQLQREHVSKAKALQNAQKFLLKNSRYQHPAFWASFLLIGNWH